jgi:predicted DNA-binding protein
MDTILNVRIPNDLAARLADHKQRTLVPTSAFVRQAIERALAIEPKEEKIK